MTLAASLHKHYLNKLFNSTYKIPPYIQSYQYTPKYQYSDQAYKNRSDHYNMIQFRSCNRYLSKDSADDILDRIHNRLHRTSHDHKKTIELRYELHVSTLIIDTLYSKP